MKENGRLRNIRWAIERPEEEDGVRVWVSVSKVDRYWSRDSGYYLGPETCKKEPLYWRFDEWIKTHREVWMPVLSLVEHRISFTNGRHRFAWFRDHGLKEMPVITDRGYGATLRRAVGR
jgi:hypothetical protein